MALSLSDRASLDTNRYGALAAAVAEHTTLERVIRWGLTHGHMVSRIVKQDEYTQDVVLPVGDGLFLVYDST